MIAVSALIIKSAAALSLCYWCAEYVAPVWHKSKHAKAVGTTLNETCRLIHCCLKLSPIDKVRVLAGIATPQLDEKLRPDLKKHHI